jgi:hypothetical protein
MDGLPTRTAFDQVDSERTCSQFFAPFSSSGGAMPQPMRQIGMVNDDDEVCLLRDYHIQYLLKGKTFCIHGQETVFDTVFILRISFRLGEALERLLLS